MISEDKIVPYKTSELPIMEGPWLVFAPHADDESFGMGGTLAKAVQKGIKIEIVVMTDGALGGSLDDLIEIRKNEAINAAQCLGVEKPVFLGNEDRGLKFDDGTIAQVVNEIERVKPKAVFFPGAFELHPDHRVTALIVWQAIKELTNTNIIPIGYEVLVQSPINTLIDITDFVEKKKVAMSEYKSQLAENRYIEIAQAMNRLRKLTLAPGIESAEGFYIFATKDLEDELINVLMRQISTYLNE